MSTVVAWELMVASAILLAALAEVVALVGARRAGKTRNVSRLVTHGLLASLALLYIWIAIGRPTSPADAMTALIDSRVGDANWGFLVLAGMLALVMWELVGAMWALRMELTKNLSRLASPVATLTVIIMMFMMNLTRWQVLRHDLQTDGHRLTTAGWWEVVAAVAVALLALTDLFSMVAARRAGKTENTSRLVSYGVLALLAIVYAVIETTGSRAIDGALAVVGAGRHATIAQSGMLVLTPLLFLAVYRAVDLSWARHLGFTTSPRRTVSAFIIATLVVLIITINLARWEMYFGGLDQGYEDSTPTAISGG